MTTSSRTRSGFSVATRSSACLPSLALTTSYPLGPSTALSRRTFSGTSSTTRIFGGRSAMVAVLPHDLDQLDDVDRLGEIPVEPGVEVTLAIAAHRLCGQGEHGDGRGLLVLPDSGKRLDAVDARQ